MSSGNKAETKSLAYHGEDSVRSSNRRRKLMQEVFFYIYYHLFYLYYWVVLRAAICSINTYTWRTLPFHSRFWVHSQNWTLVLLLDKSQAEIWLSFQNVKILRQNIIKDSSVYRQLQRDKNMHTSGLAQ